MATDSLIAYGDMARFAAAYLALVFLPGYTLATLLRPGATRVERIALAVPCALSIVALYGLTTGLVHVPFTATGYAALAALILGVGAVRGMYRPAGKLRLRPPAGWEWAPTAMALLTLVVVAMSYASDVAPASGDALSHVMWTQLIARAQVFPLALLSTNLQAQSGGFYPPVFHATAALLVGVSGVPVIQGVFYSAVAATLFLPCALFAYVRAITGSVRLAGLSVLAGVTFEPLPLWDLAQGLYPFITSCLFIPALILTLVEGLGQGRRRAIALAGVLGVGLFYTHPTEFLSVFVLGLPFVPAVVRSGQSWVRRATAGLAVAAAWGLPALPALAAVHHTMVAGAQVEIQTRHDFVATAHTSAASLLAGYVYGVYGRNVSYLLLAAVVAGAAWCLVRRRHRGLVLVQLVLALVYVDATGYNVLRPLYVLSFPWALMERLAPTHYWVVLPLAAIGIDALIRRARRYAWAQHRISVALVAVPIVGLGVLLPLDVAARHARAYSLARTAIAPADLGAIRWLAAHAPAGSLVVNDVDLSRPELFDGPIDAARWLPVLTDAQPLFGRGAAGPGRLEDRLYLLQHIADTPMPARAARLLAANHARYVFYGSTTPPLARRHLSLARLWRAPRLQLVYTSSPACRSASPGRAATCAGAAAYVFAIKSAHGR